MIDEFEMESIDPRYLAGVLDSDGSFSISRRHRQRKKCNYTAVIQLSWKKSEKTEKFMKMLVFQYGGSYAPCKSTNTYKSFPDTKDYLKYCAVGSIAEKICNDILPFLFLKQQQARNLLELRSLVRTFTSRRPNHISEAMEQLCVFNISLNGKNGWKNAKNCMR